MSKTMINQCDLVPEMASVPSEAYSCPICESESDGACWCAKSRAAAQWLIDHEVYRPAAFLEVYAMAAETTLEVASS